MSKERITRVSLEEARLLQKDSKTDRVHLRREQAEGLEPEIDPDKGDPSTIDWSKAEPVVPPRKTLVSIRVDDDVLAFFKSHGRGYQTRMNAVLRSYMDAKQAGAI